MGVDNGGDRGRVFRNMYKGHMGKTKRGRIKGGNWGWLGCGGEVWEKWRPLYLNNNKKKRIVLGKGKAQELIYITHGHVL